MSRKPTIPKSLESEFWRLADRQDIFWKQTFPDFVRPLGKIYSDPVSAGVHLVAAFQIDAGEATARFLERPASLGALSGRPNPRNLKSILSELTSATAGETLASYVAHFVEQREVSIALTKFAASHPAAFAVLQKKRFARVAQKVAGSGARHHNAPPTVQKVRRVLKSRLTTKKR